MDLEPPDRRQLAVKRLAHVDAEFGSGAGTGGEVHADFAGGERGRHRPRWMGAYFTSGQGRNFSLRRGGRALGPQSTCVSFVTS
jgi:hypothetical protein